MTVCIEANLVYRRVMKIIDFIHANPNRRGLVERSWDWKWSSTAFYCNRGDTLLQRDRIAIEWTV